jgi:small subunit ribosomal protein S1
VKAQVLEVDRGKRRIRLGLKQLQPTSVDEYIAEHKEGDVVTGRVADVTGGRAKVELGEGVRAVCAMGGEGSGSGADSGGGRVDLSSLKSMLESQWKGAAGGGTREPARAGQVRSFRIVRLDPAQKRIELELGG